jgi:hypothetical protein
VTTDQPAEMAAFGERVTRGGGDIATGLRESPKGLASLEIGDGATARRHQPAAL